MIYREESSKPILLRAVDPKRLIRNQNSYQLFNRYRVNQLQRRRHGRRGDLKGERRDGGDTAWELDTKDLNFLFYVSVFRNTLCGVLVLIMQLSYFALFN